MVLTVKFSEFENVTPATINDANEKVVGLEDGVNMQSTRFLTWTTIGRPPTPFDGLLGLNLDLDLYEYWNATTSAWVQLTTSGDVSIILALLASHVPGFGAHLIGLEDQSHVTGKFVQDLANATFIAQTDNGTLQNAQFTGSLTTGIVSNTTGTGVLSISAPLTSIDQLTLLANQFLLSNSSSSYTNIGPLTNGQLIIGSSGNPPSLATLTQGSGVTITNGAGSISISATGTGGTVTSLTSGTGITLTPGTITTTGSIALTTPVSATLGGTGVASPTAHGIMVAEGASAMTPIVLSSGQILIGSTGVDPVAAAINSGTGILVGNGAGSITVSLAAIATLTGLVNTTGGSAIPTATTLTAWIDAAIGSTQGNLLYRNASVWTVLAPTNRASLSTNATGVPTWLALTDGQIVIGSSAGAPSAATLTAGTGISITNASNSITINSSGGGLGVVVVSGTSATMTSNNTYIANNAGLVTLTLPVASIVGDRLNIVGQGAGGWSIAQTAGQLVHIGSAVSTTGVGGSVASTNQWDSLHLVCITANTTWTTVGAPQSAGLTIV